MDGLHEALLRAREFVERGLEAFHAAPVPVRIVGYTSGALLAAYGAYYIWFFGGTRRVRSRVSLAGKTVIITGCNAGIGKETAVDLATRGARVIMACRNPKKAEAALAEVRQRSGSDRVVFRQVDTSDLSSVQKFVEWILDEEDRLDILINNAGIGGSKSRLTPEGFDIVMATNHVGHFLLTLSLIDLMKKSAPSRIINVSSLAHTSTKEVDYNNKAGKGIKGIEFYNRSKLANVHFTKELARRLAGTGVTAYSLHPGIIYSRIWENALTAVGRTLTYYILQPVMWLCFLSEKDGAQTTIHCAIDESITHLSGGYFVNCAIGMESDLAKEEYLAKQLWDISCAATGVDPNKLPILSKL